MKMKFCVVVTVGGLNWSDFLALLLYTCYMKLYHNNRIKLTSIAIYYKCAPHITNIICK